MNYIIRRATHKDAGKIIEAHRRSIREICSKDYTSDQVAAWSGKNFKEDKWCQTMDKDFVWVISNDLENIFGFGHLTFHENSQAEIAGLYFVPEVTGLGLGKKLVQIMLEECKVRDVSQITLMATKTALEFYKKCGFIQKGDSTKIQIGGQPIECFDMEIQLEKTPQVFLM